MARLSISHLAIAAFLAFSAGCGSSNDVPRPPEDPTIESPQLPGIPLGQDDVRVGSITDNDMVQGANFFDNSGAVVDGSVGIIP